MAKSIPILLGLLLNSKERKYVKNNEYIPIQLEQNTDGDQVLIVDRLSLIQLRENINKLLTAFP